MTQIHLSVASDLTTVGLLKSVGTFEHDFYSQP